MSILRIKNSLGEWVNIPSIKGDAGEQGPQGAKGDKGDKGEQGEQGLPGERGETGPTGPQGETGESGVYIGNVAPTDPDINVWIDKTGTPYKPVFTSSKVEGTTTLYVDSEYLATILDGEQGIQGPQGIQGIQGPTGPEGPQGSTGPEGFSPSASVSKSGSVATISITDKTGTTSTTISDGSTYDDTEVKNRISTIEGKESEWDSKVSCTESTVASFGFTKNTGDYTKPETGIPESDLENSVQVSLEKANTALQEHQSLAAYRTAIEQDEIHDSTKQDLISATNKLSYNLLSDTPAIPTKTSDLTNDSGFLTEHQSLSAYRTAVEQDLIHDETKQDLISDIADIRSNALAGKTASDNLNGHTVAKNVPEDAVFTDTVYDDTSIDNRITSIENKESGWDSKISCTEETVTNYGFTKNVGTITEIVMNSTSKGTSGVIDLGTVITEHQDISGKEDSSNKTTSIFSTSTDTQYPSAKCVYDAFGNKIVTQTESSVEIAPNVMNTWGEISALTITLATPADTNRTNEYMLQFTSPSSAATTFSYPTTITWGASNATTTSESVVVPNIEAGKTYIVSIINNKGVIGGF